VSEELEYKIKIRNTLQHEKSRERLARFGETSILNNLKQYIYRMMGEIPDYEFLNEIEIYKDESGRMVKCCYCGGVFTRSIVPHLRKDHPEEWKKWCLDFVRLFNEGYSPRKICQKYSTKQEDKILSWTVIEEEIKKMDEARKAIVKIRDKPKITTWEPRNFDLQSTTIWAFPRRGDWATHQNGYRGNWAPEVPRNLIMRYSDEGETVLDPFVGGGTTLIECKLLGRKGIGIDINPYAERMTKKRLEELTKKSAQASVNIPNIRQEIHCGDARDLSFLEDESIDLICTHPPYADALKYTTTISDDLSQIHDIEKFCNEIEKVAEELYRVLKRNRYCAVLIGDIRRKKSIIPLGFSVMERFIKTGFKLRETIIKEQHKDKSTEFYHKIKDEKDRDDFFYRIAHEYLFIFKK